MTRNHWMLLGFFLMISGMLAYAALPMPGRVLIWLGVAFGLAIKGREDVRVFRPLDEFDQDIDALAFSRRCHAKEILDVEDTQASDFKVMAKQFRGCTEHHAWRPVVTFDDVVGDETMSPHHEVECTFTLADSARSTEQNTNTKHVDEDAMHAHAWREPIVEQRVQRGDCPTGTFLRVQQRRVRRFRRNDQFWNRLERDAFGFVFWS